MARRRTTRERPTKGRDAQEDPDGPHPATQHGTQQDKPPREPHHSNPRTAGTGSSRDNPKETAKGIPTPPASPSNHNRRREQRATAFHQRHRAGSSDTETNLADMCRDRHRTTSGATEPDSPAHLECAPNAVLSLLVAPPSSSHNAFI